MDNMTWESFPAELKKVCLLYPARSQGLINLDCIQRNIGYNLLTLGPPKGRLAELYTAMNTSTNTLPLWFDLRSSYTLSAAPIISLQPVKGIPFHDILDTHFKFGCLQP